MQRCSTIHINSLRPLILNELVIRILKTNVATVYKLQYVMIQSGPITYSGFIEKTLY